MQKLSQEFPEIPGESLQDRKKRIARFKKAAEYRQRLASGFCGRCGKGRPRAGGSVCQSCRQAMSSFNHRRDSNPDICSKCAKVPPEQGKSSCRSCLDRQRELNRKRRNTTVGNWIACVRRATKDTANGKSYNGKGVYKSKWFSWSHFDFTKAFQANPESCDLDHIIPLACAETLDGEVDHEFGRLVCNLSNLQYISHQANVLKARNQDKQAIERAKALRAQGIHGAQLFNQLWAEFAWPAANTKDGDQC